MYSPLWSFASHICYGLPYRLSLTEFIVWTQYGLHLTVGTLQLLFETGLSQISNKSLQFEILVRVLRNHWFGNSKCDTEEIFDRRL